MLLSEYDQHDGLGLADLVRRREVSARELVEAAIERIKLKNPRLNAVVAERYEQALAEADRVTKDHEGPFVGVPFLIKDLKQPHPDMPLTSGSRFLRDQRPRTKTTLLQRIEKTGAIVVARTASPEFGLVGYTEPELFGPCRNPWDFDRTPGGSSGGSAAVVAAGIAPIAQGGDGGGSIRIPASCCGLFGLKPSRGRNPIGPAPMHGFSAMLSVEHVLTRSVRDSAAMLEATQGIEAWAQVGGPVENPPYVAGLERAPIGLRIALLEKPLFNDELDKECVQAVETTAQKLLGLGHHVEPAFPREINAQDLANAFLTIWCAECAHGLSEQQAEIGRRASGKEFEATTWAMALIGDSVRGTDVAGALALVRQAQRVMVAFLEHYDILLTPTLAAPPPLIGAQSLSANEAIQIRALRSAPLSILLRLLRKRMQREAFRWVGYTPLANISGQPAMSLPLYWTSKGLPVGVHLVGRFGDEQLLFRLARQVEQAYPWFDRRPNFQDAV